MWKSGVSDMTDNKNNVVIDKAKASQVIKDFNSIIAGCREADFSRVSYANDAEPRIGKDTLTELQIMKENKDRRPKEGWQQSNFLSLGGA
jgi:hypothetical protein